MKRTEIILMLLQVPIDFLALFFAGTTAFLIRQSTYIVSARPVLYDFTLADFLSLSIPIFILWLFIFALFGLYVPNSNRRFMADGGRVVLASLVTLSFVALVLLFTQSVFDSRFLVAATWIAGVLFVWIGRFGMRLVKHSLYRRGVGVRRVILIGESRQAATLRSILETRRELGYLTVGSFAQFPDASKIAALEIDEIIFTGSAGKNKDALRAIAYATQHHIVFKYIADVFDTYTVNMTIHPVAGIPLVELRPTPLEGWGRVAKRVFDIVGSLIGLILFSPLFLFAAVGILCESGRPIIYKNERVGIRGKRFLTLKFRSMYQKDSTGSQFGAAGLEAEKQEQTLIAAQNARSGPIYKIKDDPRVTPFGRIIRRTSIDELPQFWNVLQGEMSLVGPRPHQPREVSAYGTDFPQVFTLKPGITGLAQISGRSDLSFDEEMTLDTYYIERWSLWLDLLILLKTPFILLRRRKVA